MHIVLGALSTTRKEQVSLSFPAPAALIGIIAMRCYFHAKNETIMEITNKDMSKDK